MSMIDVASETSRPKAKRASTAKTLRRKAMPPAAGSPDAIILHAWRSVVTEAALLNTGTLSDDEADACFERIEEGREIIAATATASPAGLATKVRCILDDLLTTEGDEKKASDLLRRGRLPDPADLNTVEHQHLCRLLVQLESLAAKEPPTDAKLRAAYVEQEA